MISKAAMILFVAGAGIPLMAALNSGLGARLGSPIPAAFVLFLLATTITAGLMLTIPMPARSVISAVPIQYFLGSIFVAFYVLAMTWIAPKLGIGNAIFIVLIGQLIASAVIDHYGLLNVPRSTVSLPRLTGIALVILGVYLARKASG